MGADALWSDCPADIRGFERQGEQQSRRNSYRRDRFGNGSIGDDCSVMEADGEREADCVPIEGDKR